MREQTIHSRREGSSEVSRLTARNKIPLTGRMKENLNTLHGSILLKADNRVNRFAEATACSPDGGFGASAHTI